MALEQTIFTIKQQLFLTGYHFFDLYSILSSICPTLFKFQYEK